MVLFCIIFLYSDVYQLPVGIILYIVTRTMSIALLEFLSQPQDRLGTHLCAKVSVKGGWSAALYSIKHRHLLHNYML